MKNALSNCFLKITVNKSETAKLLKLLTRNIPLEILGNTSFSMRYVSQKWLIRMIGMKRYLRLEWNQETEKDIGPEKLRYGSAIQAPMEEKMMSKISKMEIGNRGTN